MQQDNGTCQTLCHSVVPPEDAKFINDRIREDYALNWLIDGLPAAEMKVDTRTQDVFYDLGFNLGNDEGDYAEMPALNNHYDIVLKLDIIDFPCFTVLTALLQIPQPARRCLPHCWCPSMAS